MTLPALSAVLVAWNSADSIGTCIASLRRSAAAAGAALQIVVVDNASGDDSRRTARRTGADIVVENPLNAGFVVAASQGIALSRAPWVLLVNPDVVVSESFVAAVLGAAEDAPDDVAALVPDIRFAADPDLINSRGIEVDSIGVPRERGIGMPGDDVAHGVDVFGGSSCAWVLREETLRRVGGLEPAYFAYFEDVDLAWRLRRAGQRTVYVPDALALHEGSASTGNGSALKAFLVARNRRLLFRLHGPHGFRARVLRAMTELGHAIVQMLTVSPRAPIAGRLAGLRYRRLARFLASANEGIGIPPTSKLELVPRARLLETLRRKRAARSLMRH